MGSIISWLETHYMPCTYKQLFGIACPMCGTQRAITLLLKGEIIESVWMFPPLFPLLFTLIYISVRLAMRKSLANKATKIILIADGCLLLLNWFLQNFVHTS